MSLNVRAKAFYRSGKAGLNDWLERVIQYCNRVLNISEDRNISILRRVAQECVYFLGNAAQLVKQFPRLDAYQLEGPGGERLIFVGEHRSASVFAYNFFGTNPCAEQTLGRAKTWELPSQANQWLRNGIHLVVCELSLLYPFRFSPMAVSSPKLVRQEVPLPTDLNLLLEDPHLRRIRRNINRAERAGFKSYFSQEKTDFDLFYQKMYTPYVTKRFGNTAFTASYQGQLEEFKQGGLMMVTQNDKPVAAMLMKLQKRRCFFIDAGILDADETLMGQGVFTYNLWSIFRWAHEHGAEVLDLGGSMSWRSNGVFRYKETWKAQVKRFRFIQNNLFFIIQEPPSTLLNTLNQTGLINERGGKFYSVQFTEEQRPFTTPSREQAANEARQDGLSGLVVVSPLSVKYLSAITDEQDGVKK
jgi:hypothetical protein